MPKGGGGGEIVSTFYYPSSLPTHLSLPPTFPRVLPLCVSLFNLFTSLSNFAPLHLHLFSLIALTVFVCAYTTPIVRANILQSHCLFT